jgi:hypothetical protein
MSENLSAVARLTHKYNAVDEDPDDVVLLHASGFPGRATEVVVESRSVPTGSIARITRNDLQLEPRQIEVLMLSLWRFMVSREQLGLASEVVWTISDLRPSLASMFYRSDALQVERRIRHCQTTTLSGPSVLNAVIG